MAKIHIKYEKLILFGVFFRLWRNYLLFRKSVIIRDVILIIILIIRDISFRKHIVGQSFQFSKRHVLYGMFYLANQFISLEIVVIAQARCKSIAHRFLMFNV